MACVTPHYRQSTNQSLSPSYCMHPVHGQDLLRQPIGSESTHSSAAASAADSVPLTFHCSSKAPDEQLFGKVIRNKHHLLYKYLPPASVALQNYHLRPRTHNRQLPSHSGHLTDSNFFTRLLYNDISDGTIYRIVSNILIVRSYRGISLSR